MATTDARPGFRLPWSPDRSDATEPTAGASDHTPLAQEAADQESETPEMIDAAPPSSDPAAAVDAQVDGSISPAAAPVDADAGGGPSPAPAGTESPAAAAPAKKPNKFMADLTKAMQTAAETARSETLVRFNADAKQHIESIHADSATEATDLRKATDDDVAAIRDWSKAEIARIREETDERINARKSRLEHELEDHAAAIEARIERVQARVGAFESEMAEFFERLLAEEDPTRFAAMAESLPEPPPFDSDAPAAAPSVPVAAAHVAAVELEPVFGADPTPPEATGDVELIGDTPGLGDDAAADSSTDADATTEGTGTAEGDTNSDLFSIPVDMPAEDDPRLAALGLDPDFAAAEAEAAAFTPDETPSAEDIPVIADEALAARLADLVPENDGSGGESLTTKVVVVGLVSVASIAGFKRHMSRVAGIHSVGVSSGPDGEFVFAVSHASDLNLRDAITTLPGFGARVTGENEGELSVTARDPETEG